MGGGVRRPTGPNRVSIHVSCTSGSDPLDWAHQIKHETQQGDIMSSTTRTTRIAAAIVIGLASAGLAVAGELPSVDEQMAGLVQMCADTEAARAERQAEEPLYFRLGEVDKIHELTTEIVRLHNVNPDFDRFMGDIDGDALAKNVADFISTGTGGPKVYTGRDMPSAHAHLELSEADFLSAGSDVMKAMQNTGYGENEIQEMICILVSMKDLVITR
jgi:hemoglobin